MTRQRRSIIAVLAVSTTMLSAQTPRPTFEVASIKKLDQMVTGLVFGLGPPIRGGTIRMTNSTLAVLIQYAYGLRDFEVVGGPDWIRKDLFEVQAKAAGEAPRAEILRMLQSLLEDRFGLVTHKKQRDMRFFAMIPARSDGRLGPYLYRGPDTPTSPAMVRRSASARKRGPDRRPTIRWPASSVVSKCTLWTPFIRQRKTDEAIHENASTPRELRALRGLRGFIRRAEQT